MATVNVKVGDQTVPYDANVPAQDVLKGLPGSEAGFLSPVPPGPVFSGSMPVPPGVYEIRPPLQAAAPTAAVVGTKAGTEPVTKTITLIIPPTFHGDDPETYQLSFDDEEELKEYLCVNQIPGLVEVNEDCKVIVKKLSDIIDNGIYTHAAFSTGAFRRVLREAQHLQQAREDEFASALLLYLEDEEPKEGYKLREDLRLQMCADGKIRKNDVVVVGTSKAWVASHKTHVKGAKPVEEIAQRVQELAKLPGRLAPTMKAAFMVERVDPITEIGVDKACKALHVLRFKRSGHAIRVVNSMAVGRRHPLKL